jgi:transcriptional regulator
MADSLDFQKGTLDLMILKTLSWGPAHGYAVARWIEQCTDDALKVEEGSLYPAMHRLEERGFVTSEWGVTGTKREAKFYRITTLGKKRLAAAQADWKRFSLALSAVLESRPRLT